MTDKTDRELVPDALTDAARDVLAERQRQVSVEGWTPDHDDAHDDGSLACAASCYACAAAGLADAERDWPWNGGFKPADPRRMLVKAGALILAEIERLDRMVRACWTCAPDQDQLDAAAFDGDTITPLYAHPTGEVEKDAARRLATVRCAASIGSEISKGDKP